jgi:hypothetical protein
LARWTILTPVFFLRNEQDPTDWFPTRSIYDIRGNALTVTDALVRVAFRYAYDFADRPWRIESIERGCAAWCCTC